MKITVRRDNDPFKKYWWVLLICFGLAGAWIFQPLLSGTAPGYAGAGGGEASLTGEQSLDSAHNPNGARGGVIDLSMEGTGGKRKADGSTMMSSLYQAPESPEAQTAQAAAPAADRTYADALKSVSQKSDPTGWGGAKVQKAFIAPKAAFGGLTGLGSGSGGSSGSGGGYRSVNAFGAGVAKTGFASTRGLAADTSDKGADDKPLLQALKSASQTAQLAARQQSLDSAAAMAGRTFDRSAAGGSIAGRGSAAEAGGVYSNLDAAPINLKANDPNLDKFEIKEPPSKADRAMDTSDEMMKMQLAMMAIQMVAGGLGAPMIGSAISMVGMMAMMQRQQNSGSNVGAQMGKKS